MKRIRALPGSGDQCKYIQDRIEYLFENYPLLEDQGYLIR